MAINECLKSLDAKDPATAVVAFVLINRFPGSETHTALAETSAPWVEQKSSKVASNAQGAPHQSKVAKKKEVIAATHIAASAPALLGSNAKQSESTRAPLLLFLFI